MIHMLYTVCEKIVREQQGEFLWIKAYNLQENYFQSRENWTFSARTIFLHMYVSYHGVFLENSKAIFKGQDF
jgi:hypothetical protein